MKSGVVAAVLIIIIIAAVAWTVMKSGGAGSGVPERVYNAPRKVWDVAEKKVVEVKTGAWEKEFTLDKTTGYRTDGGKTYAPAITCASCKGLTAAGPVSVDAEPEAQMAKQKEYKCPLCDKPAYNFDEVPAP